MENSCDFEEYVGCFYAFLDAHKLRRSSERNAILRAVFEFNKHFTIEELQTQLQKRKCHVSRSTLYAALGLMLDAGLVCKHRLPLQATIRYEKSYHQDAHNHICIEDAEKMIEFYDPRIEELKKEIAEKYNVDVINHLFTIYCKKK